MVFPSWIFKNRFPGQVHSLGNTFLYFCCSPLRDGWCHRHIFFNTYTCISHYYLKEIQKWSRRTIRPIIMELHGLTFYITPKPDLRRHKIFWVCEQLFSTLQFLKNVCSKKETCESRSIPHCPIPIHVILYMTNFVFACYTGLFLWKQWHLILYLVTIWLIKKQLVKLTSITALAKSRIINV